MEGDLLIHLAGLAAAALAGHFVGYRSGWQDYAKQMKKKAEEAISDAAAAAAGAARQAIGTSTMIPPAVDPNNPPPVVVGERFYYLGLLMVCTAHCVRMPLGVLAPGMSAEYVDADGLVRGHYWTPEQMSAVRTEIDRQRKNSELS